MNTFMEIAKIILPACITGMITFLITKYNYHKNIPLDKYNIAFNRVYYPIYRLLNTETPTHELIDKVKLYLSKYDKFTDRTTHMAFQYLEKNRNRQEAINKFRKNIFYINSKLRHRLGYLEPNILNMYKYSAPIEKCFVRIVLDLIVIYVSALAFSIISVNKIKNALAIIFCIFSVMAIFEILIQLLKFFGTQFLKFFFRLRRAFLHL